MIVRHAPAAFLVASVLASVLGACTKGGEAAQGSTGERAGTCVPALQRCAVDFAWHGVAQASVELRGNWTDNAWTAGRSMTSFGGDFRRTLLLAPGSAVEYKYCVDPDPSGACARWETDAAHPVVAPYGNNRIDAVACDRPVCLPETGPAPEPPLRFIAVGDTGYEGINSVSAAMSERCAAEGCDFVLLLGDNIYPDGAASATDPAFKGAFEDHFAPVIAPFEVVLGNHDYGGNGAGTEDQRAQAQVDYAVHSRKWRMPSRYYRFQAGGVDFFALDTNAQMYSHDAQQRADVKAWLAQSTAPWKIAFGHHPYLSNGPHGNAGSYDGEPGVPIWDGSTVKSFDEEVFCGVVDLYMSGHDHTRQWMKETCNGTHLAVSGAGASSTSLPGTNATEFQSLDLGFLYIVVDGKKLTAEFVNGANVVEFTKTLDKPAP